MKIKFRARERFLMALYALLGMAATVAVALLIAGGMEIRFMGYAITLGRGTWQIVLLAAIAAVLLIWSVKILTLAFRHEPKVDKSSVSVQNTENGSVRISVQAMDTLVKRAIGETEGIADIKTRIINHDDSISVEIDMTLESDVHIPNVTMLMQRSIKNFIEEFSGIAVRDVTVMVSRIIEVTPMPPLALTDGQPGAAAAPSRILMADAPEAGRADAPDGGPDEIYTEAPEVPETPFVPETDGYTDAAPDEDAEADAAPESGAYAADEGTPYADSGSAADDDGASYEPDRADGPDEPAEPAEEGDAQGGEAFNEKDLW